MKTAAVIPARYGSMRFPGKVLAQLQGKPIIQWVWERAIQSKADVVLIAADDPKVEEAIKKFGGNVVMTRPDHPSGSDRIWEAAEALDVDLIVNIQGDEPMIPPSVINDLIDAMANCDAEMGTVVVPVKRSEVENNPNLPKVTLTSDGYAIYFSRSMIPYLREGGEETEGFTRKKGLVHHAIPTARPDLAPALSSRRRREVSPAPVALGLPPGSWRDFEALLEEV